MLEIQIVKHYHIRDLTASNPLPTKRAQAKQLDELLFFARFKSIKPRKREANGFSSSLLCSLCGTLLLSQEKGGSLSSNHLKQHCSSIEACLPLSLSLICNIYVA
jgi:hypothetical protein